MTAPNTCSQLSASRSTSPMRSESELDLSAVVPLEIFDPRRDVFGRRSAANEA